MTEKRHFCTLCRVELSRTFVEESENYPPPHICPGCGLPIDTAENPIVSMPAGDDRAIARWRKRGRLEPGEQPWR